MKSERPKIIVLAIVVILGGLCLYVTLMTHIAQDMILGPAPDPVQIAMFNYGVGRIPICIFPITLLALLALLLYAVEALLHRTRRAPSSRACPRCGTVESASWQFARQPVQGMGWQTVTCPQCHYEWHSKL